MFNIQHWWQASLNIQWEWPWAFFLLALPWLLRRLCPALPVQEATPMIAFAAEFSEAAAIIEKPTRSLRLILAALIWFLLVLAAARPQWQGDPVEIPVSGRDLMLAVDISGSMEQQDFELQGTRIDRLTATKAVANAFIERREGDRIGLILFGTQAYVQVPLTFDRKTVQILLDEAVIGLAGKGTAIGEAIGLTVKRLLSANATSSLPKPKVSLNDAEGASTQSIQKHTDQVLILLTDGMSNSGDISPEQAADMAAEQGLKIYTVGVGANSMTVPSFFGQQQVNPSADLDESTLKMIAKKTGGKYFRAHDTQELLSIYSMIDTLEPVERDKEIFRPTQALFMWPLAVGLVLALALMLSLLSLNTFKKGSLPWQK